MKSSSLVLFRIPNFRFLFAMRMLSAMAMQAQGVIVGWQVYSLTGNPLLLGLIGLTEAIPAIGNAFFAGHVVDNNKASRVLSACLVVLALNTFFLLMVGGRFVPMPDNHLVLCLFGGVFVSGLARAYAPPSSFTLMSKIMERKDIPAATAWVNSGYQVGAITGPAIAGLIYGLGDARIAWSMPTSLFFLSALAAFLLRVENEQPNRSVRDSFVKSVQEGWKFILKTRILLAIMSLDMFAVLFGGATAMLPAFADQVLNVGSEGLGFLRAAPAAGTILTTLFLAFRPMKAFEGRTLLVAVALFGVSMIGFGLSTSFFLSLFFLLLSGLFDGISVIIRTTMMQLVVPDHLRGRVSSVNSMFVISSNEIGAFESGLAARLLGLVPSVVVGGCATLLVVFMTAILSPELRRSSIAADHKTDE